MYITPKSFKRLGYFSIDWGVFSPKSYYYIPWYRLMEKKRIYHMWLPNITAQHREEEGERELPHLPFRLQYMTWQLDKLPPEKLIRALLYWTQEAVVCVRVWGGLVSKAGE